MAKVTAADFFACAGELRREKHDLPCGTVYVGEVGGDEWLEIESETLKAQREGPDRLLEARLICRSVMNEDNDPVFKRPVYNGDPAHDKKALEAYEAQLQKIMKMPYRVFKPLLDLVNRVNFADDKSHELLKKKSGSESSDGSSSSPETLENPTCEDSSSASAA